MQMDVDAGKLEEGVSKGKSKSRKVNGINGSPDVAGSLNSIRRLYGSWEMIKEMDLYLESLKEAENKAFNAMGEVKTGYKFKQMSEIHDRIKQCLIEVEEMLYPSENMVDIEVLVLRDEGIDK